MSARPHRPGTAPVTPEPDSAGWKRVILRGCGGTYDEWNGDYDCSHGYYWTCDECPIVIARYDQPASLAHVAATDPAGLNRIITPSARLGDLDPSGALSTTTLPTPLIV